MAPVTGLSTDPDRGVRPPDRCERKRQGMTSMTRKTVGVTGGVDTHGQSHHGAVIDHLGDANSAIVSPGITGRLWRPRGVAARPRRG
jgi:hypothetical protein